MVTPDFLYRSDLGAAILLEAAARSSLEAAFAQKAQSFYSKLHLYVDGLRALIKTGG